MNKIKMEQNKEIGEKLKVLLKLDKNPVAIKIFESLNEAEEILPKYEGKARHCQMVFDAATNNSSFYSTKNEQTCLKGSASLGLINLDELEVRHLDDIEAVGYAPLSDAKFDVDVIILYCTIMQAFDFTVLYRQATGKRFEADFAAIQSVCSESVALPYLNKKPNMSLGCYGSRIDTDMHDDELLIALTIDDVKKIINTE